jgi:hypothetical protein
VVRSGEEVLDAPQEKRDANTEKKKKKLNENTGYNKTITMLDSETYATCRSLMASTRSNFFYTHAFSHLCYFCWKYRRIAFFCPIRGLMHGSKVPIKSHRYIALFPHFMTSRNAGMLSVMVSYANKSTTDTKPSSL